MNLKKVWGEEATVEKLQSPAVLVDIFGWIIKYSALTLPRQLKPFMFLLQLPGPLSLSAFTQHKLYIPLGLSLKKIRFQPLDRQRKCTPH